MLAGAGGSFGPAWLDSSRPCLPLFSLDLFSPILFSLLTCLSSSAHENFLCSPLFMLNTYSSLACLLLLLSCFCSLTYPIVAPLLHVLAYRIVSSCSCSIELGHSWLSDSARTPSLSLTYHVARSPRHYSPSLTLAKNKSWHKIARFLPPLNPPPTPS
jgi:hypothetical protein